jgi:Bacterial protein of unknown function (DUF885)
MRPSRAGLLMLIIAGLLGMPWGLKKLEAALNAPSAEATRQLHALFRSEWDYEMQWEPLRDRARGQLGGQFDLKEFHEVVLRNGAVPLDVLEAEVNGWIASKERPR